LQQPLTQSNTQESINNQHDKMLCSDLLSTEKYVSGTYDMDVFESVNPIVRQSMQHIQQDEQRHGQELFNYMNSYGMY
jgi:spore coat protein CotF